MCGKHSCSGCAFCFWVYCPVDHLRANRQETDRANSVQQLPALRRCAEPEDCAASVLQICDAEARAAIHTLTWNMIKKLDAA